MDRTRKAIRSILLEQRMDQSFIAAKANSEDLFPSSIEQEGLTITIQLSKPGDENAIRRFKNQLRIRNPRLERIEVRQPKGPEGEKSPPEQMHYAEWRKKTLLRLKRAASEFGWDLYTDPKAGQNTDYLLLSRGGGEGKETIHVRVSEHPSSVDRPNISIDMTGQEATMKDLRARLQQQTRKRAASDRYPLI
jgi:hypothetical protein